MNQIHRAKIFRSVKLEALPDILFRCFQQLKNRTKKRLKLLRAKNWLYIFTSGQKDVATAQVLVFAWL